jgi:hypothetical protein
LELAVPDYAPGTPSWVDLGSPDPDASAAFYGQLFGWEATEPGPVEETGGYRMFQQDGSSVGGLMQLQQEGQPPAWSTYVSVADADATAAAVRENGGSVMLEPMDVMDIGRMAFFSDPAGAVFGVWQPKSFAGADLVNVPTSLAWNDVRTPDPEGAKAFYSAVFGWEPGPGPEGAVDYSIWNLDGKAVGGLMPMGDNFPPGVPPHWGICFAVTDTDATVAKAAELGGTVISEPMDMAIGRFATIADPHGATFAVMQFPERS